MTLRFSLCIALAASALLAAAPVRAQQQDEQLWFQLNANVPLADRLRLTLEQIERFGDRQDGLFQTEFGALLGYRLSRRFEFGFGYRKVGAHNGNTAQDEDRLRQQLLASFGPVAARFRIDERFYAGSRDIGVRIRPLARYNHPLGSKGLAVFVSHESFYIANTTRWGQRRGYERMRNIAGITLPLGRRLGADVGYLNQYRPSRGGARAQMDHALTLQLTINVGAHGAPRVDD